jgi:chaperonin GroEL (HSP60 family)
MFTFKIYKRNKKLYKKYLSYEVYIIKTNKDSIDFEKILKNNRRKYDNLFINLTDKPIHISKEITITLNKVINYNEVFDNILNNNI